MQEFPDDVLKKGYQKYQNSQIQYNKLIAYLVLILKQKQKGGEENKINDACKQDVNDFFRKFVRPEIFVKFRYFGRAVPCNY